MDLEGKAKGEQFVNSLIWQVDFSTFQFIGDRINGCYILRTSQHFNQVLRTTLLKLPGLQTSLSGLLYIYSSGIR